MWVAVLSAHITPPLEVPGLYGKSLGPEDRDSGLWAIYFGGGNADSGSKTTLYFAAGIDNYLHGLFGTITAN